MRASRRLMLWAGLILGTIAVSSCDRRVGSEAGVQDADQLVVYEGLPHQLFEKELLDEERKTKETVIWHDFPFYRAPLDVSADDREKLRVLLGDAGSFRPWRGEKKCGGFHPDYLAEWRAGNTNQRFLICFGCREVKVYGPEEDSRLDLTSEAAEALKEVLGNHRKNRPVRE
jgi:hypothetical protein